MAPQKTQPPTYIYDALGDFSKGINSGLNRFILTKDTLAFAVNATVRGNFVTNRPPYQRQTNTYLTPSIQPAAENALYQGSCYYAPDAAPQMLVAQIGGRLFTFTPSISGSNVAVAEVSIPGDFNPNNLPQAWLRQAERWVLVNNGVNNMIAFDGNTSKRLIPTSKKIITTSFGGTGNQFATPIIGGTVVVNLPSPYPGVNNQSVQLIEYDQNGIQTAVSTYAVVSVGGSTITYNATLVNLNDVPGSSQGLGSPLVIQPGNWGSITFKNETYTSNPNGINSDIFLATQLSAPLPGIAVVGTNVNIDGDATWFISTIGSDRKAVIFQHPNMYGQPPAPQVGDEIYQANSTQPNVVIGNLAGAFVAPAIGAGVPITLQAAYTGAIGQILFINGKQYQLTAYAATPPTPGSNTVTLENIDDGRTNHIFNQDPSPNPPVATATQIWSFPQLPPGRMMAYGMGRVWESLTDGISFMAGDIVGGSSGSPAYNFRDSVLNASENQYLAGGGSFKVPSNLGQISSMTFTSQLDASLGQGPLIVGCPGGMFSCNTPVDRTTWQSLTNPILSESLIGFGSLSQDGCNCVNGDLMFRAVDGIRSLLMARREFWSWGNTPISFEMNRVIQNDNVAGLPFASTVQFDNRELMTAAPTQGALGVYHPGLIALNFDPISSIQGKGASVYDGLWTGINVLKIHEGIFNGVHRCFAFCFNPTLNKIELYEILKTGTLDNGITPIQWSFETPMVFREAQGKGFFDLCQLENGEFYVSDVQPGQRVDFKIEYRPDFSSCWQPWHSFYICNDNTSTAPSYGDRLPLGKPTAGCNPVGSAPTTKGRWFQFRFTITGHCIFNGAKFMASIQPQPEFKPPICNIPGA